MQKMNKNTEQNTTDYNHYLNKLEELLTKYPFIEVEKDRDYYINAYEQLTKRPFMYFKALSDEVDNQAADEELQKFIKAGANPKSAYKLLKLDLEQWEEHTHDTELTIEEVLKDATPDMLNLLLERAKDESTKDIVRDMQRGKQFEAFLKYEQNNYASRVNADDLLSLEKGLLQNLKQIQEALTQQWSAEDSRTTREVLQEHIQIKG